MYDTEAFAQNELITKIKTACEKIRYKNWSIVNI